MKTKEKKISISLARQYSAMVVHRLTQITVKNAAF